MTLEFRVWDKVVGRYIGDKYAFGFYKIDDADYFALNTLPGRTLEQYTGLKDKNGNKIFEGDIVKTDQHGYNQPDSYVVKEFIQNVCVFRSAQVTDGSTMFEEATNGHDLTVIGNIHENPELLEVEK